MRIAPIVMSAVVDPAPVAARRPEEGRAHPQLVVARAPILGRRERVVRRRAHVAWVLVAARLGVRALVDEELAHQPELDDAQVLRALLDPPVLADLRVAPRRLDAHREVLAERIHRLARERLDRTGYEAVFVALRRESLYEIDRVSGRFRTSTARAA